MSDTVQSAENPGASERRLHPRKQLWFPSIELGDVHGGIILDISESGLAMRAVRSLEDGQLTAMRFQLSESQAWIETRGRIAWIGVSKKTAGVEFVGLPEEARNRIRQWIPLMLHPSGSAEENPLDEQIEPARTEPPPREPERAIFVSESETTGPVGKHQGRHSIAVDSAGVQPGTAETQNAGTDSRHNHDQSLEPAVIRNARGNTLPALYLSYQKTTSSREITDRGRTTGSRKPGRLIGLTSATAVLLVSVFFVRAHRSHWIGNNSQGTALMVPAKTAELPSDSSTYPETLSADRNVLLVRPGFVLQVGAMTHEENAEALAESLHQRDFPAFVSRRGTDRFYRVVVGPFSDVDSTLRVKERLRKQGFDALRTPWSPPTQ